MRIAAGWLFFIPIEEDDSNSRGSIEAFRLDQISALQTAVVSYESLERHSINLFAPSGLCGDFQPFDLAIYTPTLSEPLHEIQIDVLDGMQNVQNFREGRIVAHRYLFSTRHADTPYRFLRHSIQKRGGHEDILATSRRTGQSVFMFLKGSHPLSGPPQPVSGGLEGQASERDCGVIKVEAWVFRLSEDKETFFSPLFEYDLEGILPGPFIDETSGAIVWLTCKADSVQADTYYVH